ncbi:hypothetical protein BGZ60DRAFT_385021 [Tricladium varicosporioides]|nr:hypothetical protein BGZ60DRAFT_385021 [Hymenoscyphus varicosporioides]
MPVPSSRPAERSGTRHSILDLPVETKKEIFRHASTIDLIALSLVCKHFRDLAAEQLYRIFRITFDDDDSTASSPINCLAAGLETLVSSEYNYAQYLKEVILRPLICNDKAEHSYSEFMYDLSCGKFMNTLFLLTLRKAKALETFKWDIRVEISRPVFKALHQIESLQHLHLRMQAGHSNYQYPPSISTSSNSAIIANPPIPISLPPPPQMGGPNGFGGPSHIIPTTLPSTSSNSFAVGNKYASKLQIKANKALLPSIRKQPPTLCGFKHLKTLEVLDMDTLDYINELRTCIRHCSPTLTTLKLSFSESLAQKSRKPPPEIHSDSNSDTEDEFGQIIQPGPPPPGGPSSSSDPYGPSKVLKAQEEKKKQEDVLQRIFGVQTARKSTKPLPTVKLQVEAKPKVEEDPKIRFVRNLAPVAAKLMSHVKPGADLTSEGKQVLELIEKAARMYTESMEKENEDAPQTTSEGNSIEPTPATSTASADGLTDQDTVTSGGVADGPGLFDEPEQNVSTPKADPLVANPDDIDIEEPEEVTDIGDEVDDSTAEHSPVDDISSDKIDVADSEELKADHVDKDVNTSAEAPVSIDWNTRNQLAEQAAAIRASHTEIQNEGLRLKIKMEELREKMINTEPSANDFEALALAEAEFKKVSESVANLSRNMQELNDQVDEVGVEARSLALPKTPATEKIKMSEYVRSTRGLTLDTLAIYLLPIKASILSRAIDVNALQNITLLNVGPQTTFWNILAKENTISPLPLSKIYTDNVTIPFLSFVSQLNCVTDLLLLEKQKGRVESTSAKTAVTIDQIRKLALKKHAGTLKVLMLKHDSSTDWDLNVKTVMLLCNRAKRLEELAASLSNKILHTLLQFMPGLTSLRALHTLQFRTDDSCPWIMREFRRFIMDNVAHNPGMKLEYLALAEYVDRLVRRSRSRAKKAAADKKGKGKAFETTKALAEMVLGPGGTWPDGGAINGPGLSSSSTGLLVDSSDEEDVGYVIGKLGLKVEAVEGSRFCDITGVRIFERDVLDGRL